MKKLLLLSSALLWAVCSVSFANSLESLSKTQVTQVIEGKTITTVPLATLNGQLINNSFTGYFDKSGKIQGQFTDKPSNGPQSDQGTWMVKSDGTICATWQHWDNGQPICVSVYKVSNGILFINTQNKKFESMVLEENIKTGDQLSS